MVTEVKDKCLKATAEHVRAEEQQMKAKGFKDEYIKNTKRKTKGM